MRHIVMGLIMISVTVLPEISTAGGNTKVISGCIARFSHHTYYWGHGIDRIWVKSKTGKLFPFWVLAEGLAFDTGLQSPSKQQFNNDIQNLLSNLQSAAELQRLVEIKWFLSGSRKDQVSSVIVFWNKSC